MMRFSFSSCLFKVALLIVLGSAQNLSAAAPADEQARFLAGLPMDTSELEPYAREAAWQEHARDFQRAWIDVEARQLSNIRNWLPQTLNDAASDASPLFYMFSGPDFLYANAFFPNAVSYVLCGKEPVGTLPDITKLNPGQRAAALQTLRSSLNAILSYSFFITADMKNDFSHAELSGTLPVLYVFLARSGCRITGAELVKLSSEGELTSDKSKTPGVKISFVGPSGRVQSLYYFTTDLSNWGIKNNPGFIEFCKKQGQGNGFAKAASYLMHMNEFSSVRDFLLGNVKMMIQDDSGIPYRYFAADKWFVSLYGNYPGPIELFKQYYQEDFAGAMQTQVAGALPFGVGYQWRPGISSLIVARAASNAPKAVPVEE